MGVCFLFILFFFIYLFFLSIYLSFFSLSISFFFLSYNLCCTRKAVNNEESEILKSISTPEEEEDGGR